jgi:archaellum component FlaC
MKRYGIIKILNIFSKLYKRTLKAINPKLVQSMSQVSQDIQENINKIKEEVEEFKEDIKAKKNA